jgi:trehalose/maltose hydrolase-like predicted phosphorylase
MRNGVLSRKIIWISPNGFKTSLQFERFLSAADPHSAMQKIIITPENWSGTATLNFALDGEYPTYFRCGDPSFPHLRQNLLQNPEIDINEDHSASLSIKTKGTEHSICFASEIQGGDISSLKSNNSVLHQKSSLKLQKGKSNHVFHSVAVVSSRDNIESSTVSERAREIVKATLINGYDNSLAKSEIIWEKRWAMADIQIEGPVQDQVYLRFSSFNLLQMAPFHTDNISIPARAYSYNRYHGLYYWDSETFLLPFYLHTHPEVAENLLNFRYQTIDTIGFLKYQGK